MGKTTIRMLPQVVGKSKRGHEVYATNPFLVDFVIETTDRKITVARGQRIVDRDGNTIADAAVAQIHRVDAEEFVKIYTANMSAFFELSKAATKMLGCLFRAIQRTAIGKAEVFLSAKEAEQIYKELTDGGELSRNTYMRGINELIEKDFVAESPRGSGFFYINPNLIFNGDRIQFIKEYRRSDAFKEAERKFSSMIGEQRSLLED